MLQGLGKTLRCCGVDTITLQNGERHMKAVEVVIANLLHNIGMKFLFVFSIRPEMMILINQFVDNDNDDINMHYTYI